MKTLTLNFIVIIIAVLVVSLPLSLQAEKTNKDILTIGSTAPPLKIQHWVSGGAKAFQPVEKFQDGKVYVVEFWATWCEPCVTLMPHLNKLQRKYKDKGLQIISISNEDVGAIQTFLKKNVSAQSTETYAQLTGVYSLTTDPDESSHDDYLRAANKTTIPTAFIIGKKGQIEWIGNPEAIDKPLEKVINDKWDRDAHLKQRKTDKISKNGNSGR